MADRLFLFVQMEFPWALGPPDGRYLMRAGEDADPERVIVLATLGARRSRAAGRGAAGRVLGRRSRGPASAEPASVATARATIVDPVSLPAARQAQAWLDELDAERAAHDAAAVLNRVLHLHRLAAADPYVREVSPAQALVIRAGWGEGEQVADGLWLHAVELPAVLARRPGRGRGRRLRGDRTAALRPQERLAELLSARGAALLCEELVLRARLDLEAGRLSSAAVQLDAAYQAALAELPAERREDLAIRIGELGQLQEGVAAQAAAALSAAEAAPGKAPPAGTPAAADEDVVRHGLERLEAALRARTAPGFRR